MAEMDKHVVIVTGASRGLGREIALRFGRAGLRVVVNFLTQASEADAVCGDIMKHGGEAIAVRADVRNAAEADSLVQQTVERWGRIDILVNNAGLTRDGVMLRMPEQDWDDVMETNLYGPFHCIRSVSKVMMKQKTGHIVNISSITGVQGREGQANYSAAKAGLIGLTKTAAKEFGRFNLKMNAVLPGYLPTEMGNLVSEKVVERVLAENTLGRISDPREVADFIFHLATMQNVSGQVFNLDSRIL
jgi:3-oxoacyl-[acyl-carrier protein] reductase